MLKRYLEENVIADLKKKMVFISGPRQVGKTTLSKQIGHIFYPDAYQYFNWDSRSDRKRILAEDLPAEKNLLIFDEIHKYRQWKNLLKGFYDKQGELFNIIVTGSARLDIYRKGGDSLMGRYHSYRLHPLSVGELCGQKIQYSPFQCLDFPRKIDNNAQETLENLLTYGGFPEIYTSKDLSVTRRWHNERLDRIIKEDIRDIEIIRDISSMQVLAELLPSKVGSLFSLNSLREDLEVSHQTIASWVDIFERFYYHFRVYPFQNKRIRSLKKEPKLYLWDWSEINDGDIRFENLIAGHLLKFCHFLYDTEGFRVQLYYLRDKDQREADFLVTVDNKPWFCVEVKNAYREVPLSLRYFQQRLKIPFAYLVVRESGHDSIKDGVRIVSAGKFLSGMV